MGDRVFRSFGAFFRRSALSYKHHAATRLSLWQFQQFKSHYLFGEAFGFALGCAAGGGGFDVVVSGLAVDSDLM